MTTRGRHEVEGQLYRTIDAADLRGAHRVPACRRSTSGGRRMQVTFTWGFSCRERTGSPDSPTPWRIGRSPHEWACYEIVGRVTEDAASLTVAVVLVGTGRAMVDDIRLDIKQDGGWPSERHRRAPRAGASHERHAPVRILAHSTDHLSESTATRRVDGWQPVGDRAALTAIPGRSRVPERRLGGAAFRSVFAAPSRSMTWARSSVRHRRPPQKTSMSFGSPAAIRPGLPV